MDEHLVKQLEEALAQESGAVIRCLVTAETAVEDGRFNIAKVMRAAANTARVRAMQLQRVLATQLSPVTTVTAEQERCQAQQSALRRATALARDAKEASVAAQLQRLQAAGTSLVNILNRSVASLGAHRDIMETDVAQFLWGCFDCGYTAEHEPPDICPHCGALGAEFQRFGPFYGATDERLGRRRAEEIKAILLKNPPALAAAFESVDDAVLRQRPTPTEWCMKEIGGHMLDATEQFIGRLGTILGSETPQSIMETIPTWEILEGKGYPDMSGEEIVDRFRQATETALARINTLEVSDWTRQGLRHGETCNILDIGTWLANHNIAHLKQIEALREQFGHRG